MNDEVKLILTKLKIVSEEKENGAYICDKEHSKLLLSYIEQLENNRDKAYEFVKEKRKVIEWYDTDLFYLESLLKGGSDENRNV